MAVCRTEGDVEILGGASELKGQALHPPPDVQRWGLGRRVRITPVSSPVQKEDLVYGTAHN